MMGGDKEALSPPIMLFWEKGQWLKVLTDFAGKSPSEMFDWVLYMPPGLFSSTKCKSDVIQTCCLSALLCSCFSVGFQ